MIALIALIAAAVGQSTPSMNIRLQDARYHFDCKIWTPEDTFYTFAGLVGGKAVTDQQLPPKLRSFAISVRGPLFDASITEEGGVFSNVESIQASQADRNIISLRARTTKGRFNAALFISGSSHRSMVWISPHPPEWTPENANDPHVALGVGYCDISKEEQAKKKRSGR